MKRNIFRLMTLCTVAVLALASCKKDNKPQGNVPENGFLATVEANHGNGSRTHLDGNDVLWNADDQIVVRNGNGDAATYTLTDGEGTTSGTFYSGEDGGDFFQPTYTAIYPAAEGNTITDEGAATITLPATQAYVANSFANGAMPMMAVSGDQTLAFKNMLGGICFPMTGSQTVTRLVLTSNSASDHLSGVFAADYNNGQPTLAYTSGGANSITLDCGAGVTLSSTSTDFTLMVPAGSLANGFKLEAYNGEEKVFEKTNDASLGADFIPRSVIRKVNQNLEIVVPSLAVTTISPTYITTNSALGLGAVDNTPATCGILYALASDLATPADDLVIGGTNVTNLSGTAGTRFDASLTGLAEDQIYYVRAYATNEVGTVSYGDPVPFATRYDYYSAANKGKSRSVFTVDANNTRVRFSMGNLQYIGSAGSGSADDNNAGAYWKFADYQFDYFGDNGQGSTTIKQDRDLFGWGTSGINDYTPIATCWQPWSTSTKNWEYNAYGADGNANLNSNGGQADWGYNAISNGGNTVNGGWRTLQGYYNGGNTAEWNYLISMRTCGYHRYAQVQLTLKGTSGMSYWTVNQVPACGTTVSGLIVFPDSFTWPAIVNALTTLDEWSTWGVNQLTEAQWSLLEQQGAVFLPAAGSRDGTSVDVWSPNYSYGEYWSSTYGRSSYASDAYRLYIGNGEVNPLVNIGRHNGFSVRLVCPAE